MTEARQPSSADIEILVVDDERNVLDGIGDLLEECGYGVVLAQDGNDGIQKFETNDIDIVITDLAMPGVGGLDVLDSIKKKNPVTPVIILSGVGQFDDIRDALRRGAYDYLQKPANIDDLRHAVERAWDRLSLLRENENYRLRLEEMVEIKTRQLNASFHNLNKAKELLVLANKKGDKAIEELRRNEQKYRALIDKSPIGIATVDSNYQVTEVNPAFLIIMGFSSFDELHKEDVLTSNLFISSGLSSNLLKCIHRNEECFFEQEYTVGGEAKYVKCSLTPIEPQEFVQEILLLVEDITLRKLNEKKTEREARFCKTTGLINENNFLPTLEYTVQDAQKNSFNLALLHIDIDDFKNVNDQFGHVNGNRILRSVGRRIKSVTSSQFDHGVRTGGDEFAVIITHYPKKKLEEIIDRIFTNLSQSAYSINDTELRCTFSLGVAEYNGQTSEQLYEAADAATYHSKREGKNRYKFYERGMTMPRSYARYAR